MAQATGNSSIQISPEESQLIQTYTEYLDAELPVSTYPSLISNPMEHVPALNKALKATVLSIYDGRHGEYADEEFQVGFSGAIPQNEVNPRTLMASFLNKIVILEGIVTKCSLTRPKVRKSVHYCEATKAFHYREYRDATMIGNEVVTSSVYPTEDPDQNPLQTEFGLCKYADFQTISIQEMPEKAPTGQLPRSVDVILHADLVDQLKPGDRARIYGVYRSLGGVTAGSTVSPSFRTIVIANHVISLVKSVYQKPISDEEVEQIKKISKRKHVFETLSKSLAPSIYGNEMIKKAVLLLLLGGTEKNLENGTHIRGDINILMVGDPSTAKSQMLRFVLKMAPLAVATTGRGSSGVGLTAAVVSDKDTGERRLEAGAMVLADRGIVCIDEFDKMSDIDRVAIHEVMEQQTVTIAKAGIHTTLNARCSVLCAANPQYGQYDNSLSPAVNTALPDSLMSRFDLVFILLDQINPTVDRIIANHVLNMHSYHPPGVAEGEPIDDLMNTLCLEEANEEDEDDSPFEKNHPIASGGRGATSQLLKYIHYAKTRIHPQLTEQACDFIGEKYVEFREKAASLSSDRQTKVFPVTARSLESMIRLATAHAKARLSPLVEKKDAEAAVDLANYSIFRDIIGPKKADAPKPKKMKTKDDSDDENDGNDKKSSGVNGDIESEGDEDEIAPRSRRSLLRSQGDLASQVTDKPRSSRRDETSMGVLNDLIDSAMISSQIDAQSSQRTATQEPFELGNERFSTFMGIMNALKQEHCVNSSALAFQIILTKATLAGFSGREIDAAISRMQREDMLMHADDCVYFLG